MRSRPDKLTADMRETISNPDESAPAPPRPIAWVTWSLVASNIAVFLVQLYFHHLKGDDVVGEALAFSPQALAEHRYWTVLTYAWAHAVSIFDSPWLFWLHIGFNMLTLLWFGPAVEEILGHGYFFVMYLGGAVAAASMWAIFTPPGIADQGIIGASGAVYCVVAALGTLAPTDWELVIYPFALPLGKRIRLAVFLMCAVELVPMLFHWMPEVAHSAHLGGAAFGFLYVLIFHFFLGRPHLSN